MFGAESVADALESASTLKKEYDQCGATAISSMSRLRCVVTELTWFTHNVTGSPRRSRSSSQVGCQACHL